MWLFQRGTTLKKTPLTKKVAGIPEKIIVVFLFLASSMAVFITAAIIYTLLKGSVEFFNYDEVNLWDFLIGTEWIPSGKHPSFGILPLVSGTLLVTGGTIILAGPIGIGAALFLSEYAPFKLRTVMKPVIELLAGIPSIVYGFFALYTIGPIIRDIFPEADYFNVFQGVIVMTFMVLPIIVSISDDALKAVPNHLREASSAMGATKWETSFKIVIPAASSGISASILLGIARAIGETMVVALAVGSIASLHLNPLQEAMPLTAYIAQTATGDIPPGSPGADAGFAVGMVLFVIVFIINLIAGRVVLRIKKGGLAKKEPSRFSKFIKSKFGKDKGKVTEVGVLGENTVIRKIDRSRKLIKEENQALRLKFRHIKGYTGIAVAASSLVIAFIFLIFLLFRTFRDGYDVISWDFLTTEPGWRISELSIMPAIAG
ncbi:MAG: phosphate ABC transporter permease subunit PstC, partial [Candidatus Thermoplasmatota archaeon]|nr:phosphate ABC transporter permease subunit PstC [Candidatus Thermoplasmatota archaeon]